jgi:hypothetical protein
MEARNSRGHTFVVILVYDIISTSTQLYVQSPVCTIPFVTVVHDMCNMRRHCNIIVLLLSTAAQPMLVQVQLQVTHNMNNRLAAS